MPRKIGFTVLHSSSHEENFSAKELMVHSPTVSGWRSSRLCPFPQHITLQLSESSRVRRLQLLAHQYLIPAKVEFHMGESLCEPGGPGQLHRLGYVSLSDNEKTSFKARELKSVHVDATGTYLRITFHRNHANRYNQYNQVALVAINILGDSLDGNAMNTIPSREQLMDHYLHSSQLEAALDTTFMGHCESLSPLDDLAFAMYQDPEVAQLIRLLEHRKQELVRQESFEQAKSLKQAIADLHKVGERLARYDVEKKCAIEKEDYDLAKKKRDVMEQYRRSVYQQLEVHNLMDMAMITRAADPLSLQPSPGQPPESLDTLRMEKRPSASHNKQSDAVTPKLSSQPDRACSPAALQKTDVSSVPYDERPVAALHSPAQQTDGQRNSGEPEPLTDSAQREAALPIEVYGERLVAGAYSRSWSHREDALLAMYKKLSELPPSTPKEQLRNMIRAANFLLKKSLQDKVSAVFHASLKLLRVLLSQLIPGLSRADVSHCLEQTWPSLLARTGDSSGRLRTTASHFIQEIAVLKDVRALQFIPGDLVKPFKASLPSRLAQSRAELLHQLLSELGTDNSGFTLDNVMTFCTAALEHSACAVREASVRIILSMYQQHGAAVLCYLPHSQAAARKTYLYKTLFDGFAKMDGKLLETQTMKKGGLVEDGRREKEEIHSLQEQLAALKEITERGNESTEGHMPKKEAPKVDTQSQKAVKAIAKMPQDVQQSVTYLDNLCIFCGKKDESFTEDGLDLHYWKHCPMLRRCDECRQVVEIASLTEHLLAECESRSKFSQCPRCSEAFATDDLTPHVQGPACNPPIPGKGSNHCPLCHNNFTPGEEAWKTHLMGRDGCKHNSRRIALTQRTQPTQGRVDGGSRLQQACSVGARSRPMGRGSRIPAPPGKH